MIWSKVTIGKNVFNKKNRNELSHINMSHADAFVLLCWAHYIAWWFKKGNKKEKTESK